MGKTIRNFYKNAKTMKKQSKNQKRNKNKAGGINEKII